MAKKSEQLMGKEELDALWAKIKSTFFASASFTQANIQSTLGISNWALASNKPSYAFSEITGTASSSQIPTLAISKIDGLQTALNNKLETSLKGAAYGLAELDANGLVPASQLPSYVDDVLEYASATVFPSTGVSGKIYVALDTNITYRWSGTTYVEISPSLALGETSSTAYRGDRGATAYDHATDASRLTTAQTSGFYKFATTAEGHIASVTAVTAPDLNSVYGFTISGTASQTYNLATIASNASNGATAYGWGNHANAGYALASNLGTASTHAHGDYVTGITYDSTNRKLQQSKGGGTATDIVTFGSNAFNSTAYLPLAGGTMANTNVVTNLNADLLDGTHKADLFTAFSNDNDQLSSTIGGTNKKVTVGYASRSTDTKTELLTGQEFTYRQTAGGGLTYKPSAAVVKRVLGNSLVWNQLEDYTQIETYSSEGLTITNNNDGSFSVDGIATGSIYSLRPLSANMRLPKGHKILVKGTPIGASLALSLASLTTYSMMFQLTNGSGTEGLVPPSGRIFNLSHDSGIYALKIASKEGTEVHAKYRPLFFDLTLMFGAGNEPSTVEEFEALYPNAYYEYNAGTIINNSAKAIENVGFNLWDEEWEGGIINEQTGNNESYGQAIRSKNKIRVFPSTTYFYREPTGSAKFFAYDANENYIGVIGSVQANNTFVTGANTAFIRFQSSRIGSDIAYNNNICINISDTSQNGTYEPYKKNVLPLFPLKCKAPNGDIVIITDAKRAGSVRDERVGKKFIQRVGSVDCSSMSWVNYQNKFVYGYVSDMKQISNTQTGIMNRLTYATGPSLYNETTDIVFCTNDGYTGGVGFLGIRHSSLLNGKTTSEEIRTALSGYILNYELATPIEYEIIDEAPYEYPIDVLGTERIVSDELVAPFVADIQYGAEQRNVAYDINSLHSNALALKGRASVLESYFTDGVANNAARLSNTSAIGSITKPVYFTDNGVPSACSDYAGGTAVTLNGTSKAANTASFYAPTDAGTSGQILKSTAGTPEWINQSAITAGALTTVSKTAWGRTYWTSGGVPDNISGDMSNVGNIAFQASGKNIGGIAYFDTTNLRLGIGTNSPAYPFHVVGDIYANGGWLRTSGSNGSANGWQSQDYGGGWYCDDYTYVKTYGNRSIYTAADVLAGGNIVGTKGVASQGIANLSVAAISGSNFVTQVKIGSTAYNPSDGVVSLPAYPTVPTALSGFTNDVGYITNVTGNQVTNALGYEPAKKQASTETVTGNTYDAGGKAEVYDVWTPTGTTATFKLPYDPARDIVNYVLVVNNLSSDITVSFVPQVGTAHIIAPSNSLVVPAGKAIEVSYLTQLIGSTETVVLSWSSAFSQYTIQ